MFKIEIDKTILPYKFELNIKGELFDFIINYNRTFDFFTITLIKDDLILIESEKIILNQFLFSTVENKPSANMGVFAINEETKEITFDNINFKTIFAYEEV